MTLAQPFHISVYDIGFKKAPNIYHEKKDDVKRNSPNKTLFTKQLVAASITTQRLPLLPDRSCNEIQLVLQLTMRPPPRTDPQKATLPYNDQKTPFRGSTDIFLDNLLHKKGLKSVLFHLVLPFMLRLNEG